MFKLYCEMIKTKIRFKMWGFRIRFGSKLVASSVKSIGKETKKSMKYGKSIVEDVKSLFSKKKK